MSGPDSSPEGEVELARFRDEAGVEDCRAVLDAAGIKYRVSTDAPAFDISAVGTGGVNGSVIIMIAAADEVNARQKLLDDARLQVRDGVAADYHLQEWSNEDLLDTINEPLEWSAADVAAAEAILKQRGVSFQQPTYVLQEKEIESRAEKAKAFRQLNRSLIIQIAIGLTFAISLAVLFNREDSKGMAQFRSIRMLAFLWLIWLLLFKKSKDDEE